MLQIAEFNELIKNFDKIKDYMRDFYIYGYKVRNEYTKKSARTYDNERRRIESWMADYIEKGQTTKGKKISLSIDSNKIASNPFYRAWKSKSFTSNDIMLHFFLLDQLNLYSALSVDELADHIMEEYKTLLDVQIIRRKLKEYEELGILNAKKRGKQLFYSLCSPFEAWKPPYLEAVFDAVAFFQEAAPFGFVGNTIMEFKRDSIQYFRFKHDFLVHTLEDGILLDVLDAIQKKCLIRFQYEGARSKTSRPMQAVPLRIMVSTQSGRRYVCFYMEYKHRFTCLRLDRIRQVHSMEPYPEYHAIIQKLNNNICNCWGVTFGERHGLNHISIKLLIDEKKEDYILQRLLREGHGGRITRLEEGIYQYEGDFFDINEMLPWVKTFTGRILSVEGTDALSIQKIYSDMRKMYQMYCQEDKDGTFS